MTAFQAAILLAQFERLPVQIAKRTQNVKYLKRLLADVSEISWQEEPEAMTQCSWYLLVGKLRSPAIDRDGFVQRLQQLDIPCTPFYPHTLYRNPLYQSNAGCRAELCPVAEQRTLDGFWFPHRVFLSEEDTMEELATAIQSALPRGQSFAPIFQQDRTLRA